MKEDGEISENEDQDDEQLNEDEDEEDLDQDDDNQPQQSNINDNDDDDDIQSINSDNEYINQEDEEDDIENINQQDNDIKNKDKYDANIFDNFTKNNLNNIDLENNDSIEFLQKFNKEYKNDYIANYHQESLSKNFEEIKKLTTITKDNNNIIIDNFHKTIPLLTKYEKTKILGIRLKQLNNGAKPYITISDTILDNYLIANMELMQKALPFIISRPLPNNTTEYWKLQDLEIL